MFDFDEDPQQIRHDRVEMARALTELRMAWQPEGISRGLRLAAGAVGTTMKQQAVDQVRKYPAGSLLIAAGFGLMTRTAPRRATAPIYRKPQQFNGYAYVDHPLPPSAPLSAKVERTVRRFPLAAGASALGLGVLAGSLLAGKRK